MPDLFPFVNHTPTHSYPKGDSFQFGGGYEFAAAPSLPIQRRFKLHFKALKWYFDGAGVPVNNVDTINNALAFDEFYRAHLTHIAFNYAHQAFGTLLVKFASDSPFEMPKTLDGGMGVTDEFDITLVEQPV